MRQTDNKKIQVPVDVIFIVTDSSRYQSSGIITCKLAYVRDFFVEELQHKFTVESGLSGTMDIPRNIRGGSK